MIATRRQRVLLTGAAGNWGRAILREFVEHADRYQVVALVLHVGAVVSPFADEHPELAHRSSPRSRTRRTFC